MRNVLKEPQSKPRRRRRSDLIFRPGCRYSVRFIHRTRKLNSGKLSSEHLCKESLVVIDNLLPTVNFQSDALRPDT